MAARQLSILVVDDERNTREGLARALKPSWRVSTADSASAALAQIEAEAPDVMLSDVRMPGDDGLALLKRVRERYPAVVCIMLTAYGSVETAVEAMKLGAQNFLTKPVNLDQLDMVLAQAVRARDLERENRDLRQRLDKRYGMDGIVGSSPAMEALFDTIRQVAPTQATVLIEGASGTGKELVAQAIHHLSQRSAGPFVAVHCAALSPTLLESELFGHEKGAFTNALSQRKGRFELAQGGTLFLDEVGEIAPEVQVKLLRVLETRSFERVGGTETLEADIRIVAATNRDLAAEVAAGRFREDLYFRLNVVEIKMPPLASRTSDIPLLCNHYLKIFADANGKEIAGIEPAAMALLQTYPWPGNVRELRNAMERLVVFSRGGAITAADIPAGIREGAERALSTSGGPAAPAAAGQ
ncbi:MAG: sigma-54-dependent Fis family transcriptional regulator, partial [Kiritimatiellae bacterium]|nr:sigma-54-dependent Fis family transcriptional regulator [Kiritimatiellia bacterium]